MSKAFAGVDDLIDGALGVAAIGTSSPHYLHKAAALLLRSRPASLVTPKLFQHILSRIQANLEAPQARWRTKGGSKENWRWEKKLKITSRKEEKTVEKLIAANCGDCWVNQVPTASGLFDKTSETHCNIDLVNRTGVDAYEFIELKYDDGTPLFAAFEILKYTLLFLISHDRLNDFQYTHERNPLIWAKAIQLIVLAPADYYAPYSLRWLQEELNSALSKLSTPELAFRFAFEKMPWPHDRDCESALRFRERVYANCAVAASRSNITGLQSAAGG